MKYLFLFCLLIPPLCAAQQDPPSNPIYPEFKLQQLEPFLPGKSVNEIKKLKGAGQPIQLKLGLKILQFNITHQGSRLSNSFVESYIAPV